MRANHIIRPISTAVLLSTGLLMLGMLNADRNNVAADCYTMLEKYLNSTKRN